MLSSISMSQRFKCMGWMIALLIEFRVLLQILFCEKMSSDWSCDSAPTYRCMWGILKNKRRINSIKQGYLHFLLKWQSSLLNGGVASGSVSPASFNKGALWVSTLFFYCSTCITWGPGRSGNTQAPARTCWIKPWGGALQCVFPQTCPMSQMQPWAQSANEQAWTPRGTRTIKTWT